MRDHTFARERPGASRGFTLIELLFVFTIIALVAAIAIPNLIQSRKQAYETTAIGALKTIGSAEALFKEGDKNGNSIPEYATLSQLKAAQLVDEVLGSGTKQGYIFSIAPSSLSSEVSWFGVANPVIANGTGDRYFETNQGGVIYYTSVSVRPLNNTSCQIATPTVVPVGK